MLALMKGDDLLTDLVPAAHIYPQSTAAAPFYPFIRCGSPTGVPVRAACVDGLDIVVDVHGFSGGRREDDALVESAEDHAAHIGAAIARALDGQAGDIDGGRYRIRWTGSRLLQDPEEASVYHTVQSFQVRCITA